MYTYIYEQLYRFIYEFKQLTGIYI